MKVGRIYSNKCCECGKTFIAYRALIECYACGAAKHRR